MGIFSKNREKRKQTLREELKKELAYEMAYDASLNQDYSKWNSNTEEYKKLMQYLDLQENLGFCKIEGLPYHTYQVLQMLYVHGQIAFVKNKIGLIEMCQIIPTAWHKNGYIHKFRVLQSFQNRELLSNTEEFVNHFNGVILYDCFNFTGAISRATITTKIIDDMCELFQRLQDNILLSGDRLAFNDIDIDNQDELKKELLNQFKSGNPVLLFSSMFGDKIEGLKTDAKFMELWSNIKQYDMFRQRLHGIGNGSMGNDKAERLITGELETQKQATDLVLECRKTIWTEWVQEMNSVLQTPVTVTFNV